VAASEIIVGGHICLDLFPGLDGVPAEVLSRGGALTEVGKLTISTGGAVSNTGLALHRLGLRVGLMATVGDDLLGQMICASLRAQGPHLADHIRPQPHQSSSYSVVLAPERRDRSFLHFPGTNLIFGTEHVDFEALAGARIFHLGYPPLMPRLFADDGAQLRELFARAKELGVVTSMDMVVPDPNGPSGRVDWRKLLKNVLPFVDVFLPSLDEARFMLQRVEFDRSRGDAALDRAGLRDLIAELLDFGAVVAGLKLGDAGLTLRTAGPIACVRLAGAVGNPAEWADKEHWQAAYQVAVEGTTGAGDAAYAGFLAAMLRGLPPHGCLQIASAVGACCVERQDATSGVRGWDETLARLESGWQTRSRQLPS
jgi:sugar/nucleoside kinase (ribokinase family)